MDPREAKEIAKHTGTTTAMVHQVIAASSRLGVAAVETPGKEVAAGSHVTREEEPAFLAPFFTQEDRGEIATAGEIQRAFEVQLGHKAHKSTSLSAAPTAWMAQTHATARPPSSQCPGTSAV